MVDGSLRFRKPPTVIVADQSLTYEAEPNDAPGKAKSLAIGTSIAGRSGTNMAKTAIDYVKFAAHAGEKLIIETEAERIGSTADTRIEIVDGQGRPIDRVWLQAVRDSTIDFRNISSTQLEIRCFNWEEMELNDLIYMRGEVSKLFRFPQGPDSGFLFYAKDNKRITYFDTTSTAHALADPVYIVRALPPGTQTIPNGLPIFSLAMSMTMPVIARLAMTARSIFTAPSTGEYYVRISNTKQPADPASAYRLTVRKPQPSFSVNLVGVNPTVNVGSGRELTFVADRIDEFDGPIQIDVTGLPDGFDISKPIVIEAGHLDARATLFARADAKAPPADAWKNVKISAWAILEGETVAQSVSLKSKNAPIDQRSARATAAKKAQRPVNDLGKVTLAAKPKLACRFAQSEVTIEPGGTATVDLIIERNDFKDRVSFAVDNLPHGVIVDNIGLNGILINPNETRRQIFLTARKWVGEQDRPFHALALVEGNQSSPPIILRCGPTNWHRRISNRTRIGRFCQNNYSNLTGPTQPIDSPFFGPMGKQK